MYFNVFKFKKYYVLDVCGLNYNSIHIKYGCGNFKFFDKKCIRIM